MPSTRNLRSGIVLLLAFCLPAATFAADAIPKNSWHFDFGTELVADGSTAVTPHDVFDEAKGYGFESSDTSALTAVSSSDDAATDCIASSQPFYFSVKLPEGGYRVTLTTGAADRATRTTVKAELRRLMLHGIETERGQFQTNTFLVNIRTPRIDDSRSVRLKDRETKQEWRAWDDRLTLEFNDRQPAVASISIEPVNNLPVLYIVGDSTVCDQPSEDYNSWGQMITAFFKPGIVVANHGESGESYRGAMSARRFEKVFSQMKDGDFLIVQFGHNDMKSVDEADFANSIRKVVAECRQRGGVPIIVSSMERRGFDPQGRVRESLRGFPAAASATAKELGVAFIDLHSMSMTFYESLGPEKAPLAFARGGADPTHHNSYGSYQLAKCVLEGIRKSVPDLEKHIVGGLPAFDPAQPDDVASFSVPASPGFTTPVPEGT